MSLVAPRAHARLSVVLGTTLATALGLVFVPPAAVAAPAPAPVPDTAPDEASASVAARQGDKTVRVDSLTDEVTEVRANPDGSFTMTQHVRPVRVKQAGEWTPVDTTLVQRADGTIGPRAAAVDMTLSAGGGSGPLVTIAEDGAEVGLVWPRTLPRPELAGPTATYPEVLPGVDLKVTADVEGFSQVLVIKDRAAAANPDLRAVTFGTHTENVTVSADEGNGSGRDSDVPPAEQEPGDALTADNSSGDPVFIGDATRMWDSSGEATAEERLTGTAVGVNTAAMAATVSDTAVVIEPDQEFLADPDTAYPVYLDPNYTCGSCDKTHHAVVQSAFPDARNFNRTDGDFGDLKAGYVCEGPCFVSRTYLGMHTGILAGRHINSAYLHADVAHSYHCGSAATATELWITNSINSAFTWRTQENWRAGSGWARRLSTSNVTNNRTYCPGSSGMDLDAKSAIVDAAANRWATTTLMLKGSSESSNSSWRRFGLNPHLVVGYNTYPAKPTHLGINGWGPNAADATPCTTGAGRVFVTEANLRLRARVSDPDGGTLDTHFQLSGPNPMVELRDASTPSGQFAEVAVAASRVAPDGVYSWRLRTSDGQLQTFSDYCEMQVDTTAPAAPVVTSAQYPAGRPAGGVGVASTFTFSPPATDPHKDIDYYLYGFTSQGGEPSQKTNPDTLNAPASVPWTPLESGPQTLSVRGVDRAGNPSALVQYRFDVADYQVGVSGKVAHWSFEDNLTDTSETKTLDYVGPPPPGGFFDAGANEQGLAVHLDGVAKEYYQAKDSLIRTDHSFTLSAWAKLGADDRYYTVLSQDGEQASGVKLQYNDHYNRWAVSFTQYDADEPGVVYKALSENPPSLGQWTHLTGVYDAPSRKLRIYVNGALSGEDVMPVTPWNATGPFVVGAAKVADVRSHHFTGAIDAARVHDRALTDAEITGLHNGTANANPLAEYLFEGNLVNTGANHNLSTSHISSYESGYAHRSLALTSGPRPRTAGPVVNTTDSFSAAAWVKLENKDRYYAVMSQDGQQVSAFLVRYSVDVDRWIFGMANTDDNSDSFQWAVGTSVPKTGVWTHLVAVRDAETQKNRLYVNGVLEKESDATAAFISSGPFAVGSAKHQGNPGSFFVGGIDEVNVYDGVLTSDEVASLMNAPVERARYRLDEPSGADAVPGGAPATVHGTGVSWGEVGGRRGAVFTGHTEGPGTASGAGPSARWSFDSTLTDSSGNARHVELRNASGPVTPTYSQPWVGSHGIQLDGTDQRLQRAGPVIDTSSSFSVSAWVKLDRDNGTFTVVSQDGSQTSPFLLQYSDPLDRWTFTVTHTDVANPAVTRAVSDLPGKVGSWSHLVAIYDATTGRARLHVDGELDDDVAVPQLWQAGGPFVMGRHKWNGAQTGFLPGALDEVKVYDYALTAEDAHDLWNLGSNIYAPQPVQFRSDQSFTLAAWVRPDRYDEHARQAISFGGSGRFSALSVGYRPEWKRWGVLAETNDAAAPDPHWLLSDNEAATYGVGNDGWVHLIVAYDAPASRILFYVNGIRQSTVPLDGTRFEKANDASPYDWYAGANLRLPDLGDEILIGRITWMGHAGNNWPGAIGDVRAFSGLLPDACDGMSLCTSQLMVDP